MYTSLSLSRLGREAVVSYTLLVSGPLVRTAHSVMGRIEWTRSEEERGRTQEISWEKRENEREELSLPPSIILLFLCIKSSLQFLPKGSTVRKALSRLENEEEEERKRGEKRTE